MTAILVALVAASGCIYVPSRSLEYDPIQIGARHREKPSLVVMPLREERPPRHYPSQFGNLFLTYVPIIPYVKIPYERLDESAQMHESRRGRAFDEEELFPTLLARQIAEDLERSGLFRSVTFAPDADRTTGADLVLTGALRSSEFDVYATSYMLGIAGVLLWIAPIPIGSNAGNVEANLLLRDASGREVWRHALQGRGSKLFTLYNSGGAPISSRYSLEITRYGSNDEGIDPNSLWAYHASALRKAMGEAKVSLEEALARRNQ